MHYVIALVGKSGTGKTQMAKFLCRKLKAPIHISYTTREMRENEKDGRDYHFVTKEEFQSLSLLEKTEYAGNFYGIGKDSFNEILKKNRFSVICVDKNGLRILKSVYNNSIFSILLDMPEDVRIKILSKRDGEERASMRMSMEKDLNFDDISFDKLIHMDGSNWNNAQKEILFTLKNLA